MPNLSTFLSLGEICLKEINDESRLPQDPGKVINSAQRPQEKSQETDEGRAPQTGRTIEARTKTTGPRREGAAYAARFDASASSR